MAKRGQPAKVDRPVRLEIRLPESLHTRLELLLFSELEGRVPQGKWSAYFESLARDDLGRLCAEQSAARGLLEGGGDGRS